MTEEADEASGQFWKATIHWSVAATGVWIVGGLTVAVLSDPPIWNLGLNEAGDFFAGIAGPAALYWLVLGFFQQGRELRIQARELRHSVEQFRIQSEHMGRDLEHAALLERKNQARRLFELRAKQVAHATELLYRATSLGMPGAPGTTTLFTGRPNFYENPSAEAIRLTVHNLLGQVRGIDRSKPDVWPQFFAAYHAELTDFPLRANGFGSYLQDLRNEAIACDLKDISFEIERDDLAELSRILLLLASKAQR